ncbi:MAG: hypothetical protein ACYC64_13170 [Armatimonadota bacterium]
MTTLTEVFARVISELKAAEIDYMIVGSIAASAHGHVRDTHDLDLVVVISREALQSLLKKIGEEFYVDTEGAEEALQREDMFNIIHYDTSAKVDFWILKGDELSTTQFARRQLRTIWGVPAYVESAEDTILSKLLWNQISPSERQLSDVAGILNIQKDKLDYDYLREWAAKKGVLDTLDKLIKEN